jgi:phage shock protein C
VSPKRFHRVESGKKIAGVCLGLSEYFNIDVTLVRVLFVVLALAGGAAVLAYVILWLVAPGEEHPASGA